MKPSQKKVIRQVKVGVDFIFLDFFYQWRLHSKNFADLKGKEKVQAYRPDLPREFSGLYDYPP